jgi:hypothetical protein
VIPVEINPSRDAANGRDVNRTVGPDANARLERTDDETNRKGARGEW